MQIRAFYVDERTPEEIARKVREMARLGFGLHLQAKGARGENILLFFEGAVAVPDRQDGERERATVR